jgi:hypothetical protein
MDLAAVLDELVMFLGRYVSTTPEALDACALYVAHTYVIAAFDTTPYVNIGSPEKECGKSQLGEMLGMVCRNPLEMVSVTPATLYRLIGEIVPTMIVDELDQMLKKNPETVAAVFEIVNAGYRRGKVVRRCEPPKQQIREYPVFCPKVLIGIDSGRLPDTTASRTIKITLQRVPVGSTQRYRYRRVREEAEPIKARFEAWAMSVDVDELARVELADAEFPHSMTDGRLCDIWEPLFVVANLASPEWKARSFRAAATLSCVRACDLAQESHAVRMLAAVRDAFDHDASDRLSTAELIRRMAADSEAPWAKWIEDDGDGAIQTRGAPSHLANTLRRFGAKSHNLRIEGASPVKGWRRADLEDAFTRYLPILTQLAATPATTAWLSRKPTATDTLQPGRVAGSEPPANPHRYFDVADVAAPDPQLGDARTHPPLQDAAADRSRGNGQSPPARESDILKGNSGGPEATPNLVLASHGGVIAGRDAESRPGEVNPPDICHGCAAQLGGAWFETDSGQRLCCSECPRCQCPSRAEPGREATR